MMMELAVRAALRLRPGIDGGIDREDQGPVPRPGRDQQVPQRLLIDPALAKAWQTMSAACPRIRWAGSSALKRGGDGHGPAACLAASESAVRFKKLEARGRARFRHRAGGGGSWAA